MLSEHLFARNEILGSWWGNVVGRALSVMAAGFTVQIKDATHVRVPAGADDKAAVIAVEGRWRWVEAEVSTAHPGGADGTYDVFVTAADNNIVNVPDPLTDSTDRSFALAIVAHGGSPGGVALARKVAEVGWAGGALTWIHQLVPAARQHRTEHEPGGSDQLTGLTDANFATANKDGTAGTASLRTLGAGAAQAAAGNDARLTNARTPTAHAASHQPGGADALAVDAAVGTGSLRTLGGGATQAAPGNDSRLSNARTPTAHASTHQPGGADAMAVDAAAGVGSLRTIGAGALQAAAGNDARLTDSRTPTAHAASHQPGGGDAMAVDAAAGTGSLRTLGGGAAQAAPGNDARLSDARAPTAHHASHQPGGSDAMVVDAAAGTGSLRTIGGGALQAAAGNHSHNDVPNLPSAHANQELYGHINGDGTIAPGSSGGFTVNRLGAGQYKINFGVDFANNGYSMPLSCVDGVAHVLSGTHDPDSAVVITADPFGNQFVDRAFDFIAQGWV